MPSFSPLEAQQRGQHKRERVIVCYTGGVGRELVRQLLHNPAFELVGVLMHSVDKDGQDVGEIVWAGPFTLKAKRDITAFTALRANVMPWHGLGNVMHKVAGGDMTASFRGTSRDELGELGAIFNGTVGQIQDLIRRASGVASEVGQQTNLVQSASAASSQPWPNSEANWSRWPPP